MISRKTNFYVTLVLASTSGLAQAAISYATLGSLYQENFNSLPKDTPGSGSGNVNVETVYVNGWQDDSVSVANTSIGLPGVYLYHPLVPTATAPALPENGTNDHQRIRFGPGVNTGSFWGFGSSTTVEDMALGSLGSATVAADNTAMYIAIRITNNTGIPLNAFTLTYDGEQWRDGASPGPETLVFGYSTVATASDWFGGAVFTSVAALNFSSLVVASTTGAQVNGNVEGLTSGITATITGMDWQPGSDLWLRWADNSLPTLADDGLAIDNVRFSAVPEPSSLLLLLAGALLGAGRRRSN